MLTLFEELYLLSIHEEKGTVIPNVRGKLRYGLGGAILAQLALDNKIRIDGNHRIEAADPSDTGDTILDKALQQIQASMHPRKTTYWVRTIGDKPRKLRGQLSKRLVADGVFQQEETRLGWVVPYAGNQEQKASAKYWLESRLREVALTQCDPSLHDLALLSLIQASGMLRLIFTKYERKLARQRVYELMIGTGFNNPIAQSIEDISASVEALVAGN